jgi:hypothetical protein
MNKVLLSLVLLLSFSSAYAGSCFQKPYDVAKGKWRSGSLYGGLFGFRKLSNKKAPAGRAWSLKSVAYETTVSLV